MKKILLLSTVFCFCSFNIFAQISMGGGRNPSSSTPSGFSIGVEPGLLTGDASSFYKLAIGGDLKYAYPVSDNISISLSAGYTELIGKSFTDTEVDTLGTFTISAKIPSLSVIPVKVGARYCLDGTTGFFGEVQVGAAFVSDGGGTALTYSPAIGYVFDGGFEAGVRYEGWEKSGGTISQVSLRLAFSF